MSVTDTIRNYPRPSVAVDLVILTILDADLKVLLIRRSSSPFEGELALPGGFVRVGERADEQGEDVLAAARRELAEETGLSPATVYLEQLYTFGKAGRDPRGRVISVVYYALVRPDLAPFVEASGDAREAQWVSVSELDRACLAFDHGEMLTMALERVQGKLDYAPIAFELVPKSFSVPELRAVFEVLLGESLDRGNFRRRFNRMLEQGLIESAPGKRITTKRPAQVYRYCQPASLP